MTGVDGRDSLAMVVEISGADKTEGSRDGVVIMQDGGSRIWASPGRSIFSHTNGAYQKQRSAVKGLNKKTKFPSPERASTSLLWFLA